LNKGYDEALGRERSNEGVNFFDRWGYERELNEESGGSDNEGKIVRGNSNIF